MDKNVSHCRMVYFTVLWSLTSYFTIMIHRRHGWIIFLVFWIFLLAKVTALWKPKSLKALVFLVVTGYVYLLFGFYTSINNSVLESFVDFVILTVLLLYFLTRRQFHLEYGDIYSKFAPIIRIYVIAFYFFTFFSKLNTDFLDPRFSCAAQFMGYYQTMLPVLAGMPWLKSLAIFGTIITEGSLPFLFIFRQTRHWAIVWGLIFHAIIGLCPFHTYDFSLLMLVLYFVFISDDAFERMRNWGDRISRVFKTMVPTAMIRYLIIACVVFLPQYISLRDWHPKHFIHLSLWVSVYFALAFIYVFAIVLSWRGRHHSAPREQPFRDDFIPQPAVLLILVIPFVLNGIAPYLGIKTRTTWSMYSNLSTTGPRPNHLIVPASFVLFKQGSIKILDSNNPKFKYCAAHHWLLPEFEFRRLINIIPGTFFVRCLYNGKEIIIHKNRETLSGVALLKPAPWFNGIFTSYKMVDENEHCRCESNDPWPDFTTVAR